MGSCGGCQRGQPLQPSSARVSKQQKKKKKLRCDGGSCLPDSEAGGSVPRAEDFKPKMGQQRKKWSGASTIGVAA